MHQELRDNALAIQFKKQVSNLRNDFFYNGYLKITRIKKLITFGTLKDLLCNPSWRAKNSRRDVREQLDTTIGTMT